MKTLFVVGQAFRTLGGAALSCLTFLRRLEREFGWKGKLATQHPISRREWHDGVELISYPDLEGLKEMVTDSRPDVILGATTAAVDAVRVAAHYQIPSAVYILSYEILEPSDAERQAWGIPPQKNHRSAEEAAFVYRTTDRVFSCSQYMKRFLEGRHGVGSEVLYPEFDSEVMLLEQSDVHRPKCITGLCGFRHKGAEIFLGLADAFPEERFLLVGHPTNDMDLGYRRRFEARENIELCGRQEPREFLTKSKLVLVPSQWPEPFGRIAVESMANRIPVLASVTGGLEEILDGSSMGVPCFSDEDAWTSKLTQLLESTEVYESSAEQGPLLAKRFLEGSSTRQLTSSLEAVVASARRSRDDDPIVAFYGDTKRKSAYSLVNAFWSRELGRRGWHAMDLDPDTFGLPDFVIHHNYEARIVDFVPPETGKLIACRSWDYGPYPSRWVKKINESFDQLWVHSHWVERCAHDSGIDPDRVRVVPLGVDVQRFGPKGPVYELPTQKRFKFLFVGGAVQRKGIDILLAAYGQAFTREDDVCLVIKDHSQDPFYRDLTYKHKIQDLVTSHLSAAVLYIDEFLSTEELASLYRACDVGVFPYRAEGFCIPVLEAMASGVPSMVPNLGATADFCSDETSFLMPAVRVRLPVHQHFKTNLGFEEDIDAVDFPEVRVQTLVEFLQRAYRSSDDDLNRKSLAGVRNAREHFTLEHSIVEVENCLKELSDSTVPRRVRRRRAEEAKSQKKLEVALQLYLEGRER